MSDVGDEMPSVRFSSVLQMFSGLLTIEARALSDHRPEQLQGKQAEVEWRSFSSVPQLCNVLLELSCLPHRAA